MHDGQAARVQSSPTDNSNKEQNSSCDQQQQVSGEGESCCVDHGVIQEKSESSLTPDITQALAARPLHTQRPALELCWYWLKSLSIEELNIQQMEQFCGESQVQSEALTLPSGGERLKYQRDPRPHFGVAHSSRSVSFALWDTDRLREMKEEDEEEEGAVESVSCCPHCHLGLPRDTLLWHEAKCLSFVGVKAVQNEGHTKRGQSTTT